MSTYFPSTIGLDATGQHPTFPKASCMHHYHQLPPAMLRHLAQAGPSRLPAYAAALPRAAIPVVALQAAPPVRAFNTSATLASGHSRWSKIRHRKGAADAAKSKAWSGFMTVSS